MYRELTLFYANIFCRWGKSMYSVLFHNIHSHLKKKRKKTPKHKEVKRNFNLIKWTLSAEN